MNYIARTQYSPLPSFEPCPLEKEPTGDEIVVFDSAQVLPRYIVRYEILRRPHVKEKRTET